VSGLIYRDARDFERMAERLIAEDGLRERLGAAGRQHVSANFSLGREIDGYLAVYAAVAPVIARGA
jgi:glycosyltransferase involved in cell wall biosynthesis